jgi:hypothetical protein
MSNGQPYGQPPYGQPQAEMQNYENKPDAPPPSYDPYANQPQQQYGGQPPYGNQQPYQQPYPNQPPNMPPPNNGPPNGGGYGDEKVTFDQNFKIQKPKWNDLWAGILFLLVCAGFTAVSAIALQGYGKRPTERTAETSMILVTNICLQRPRETKMEAASMDSSTTSV